MNNFLLWIVTGIYAFVAIDLLLRREWIGVTFAAYAMANFGMIMVVK